MKRMEMMVASDNHHPLSHMHADVHERAEQKFVLLLKRAGMKEEDNHDDERMLALSGPIGVYLCHDGELHPICSRRRANWNIVIMFYIIINLENYCDIAFYCYR
jgi:hypothetical protein